MKKKYAIVANVHEIYKRAVLPTTVYDLPPQKRERESLVGAQNPKSLPSHRVITNKKNNLRIESHLKATYSSSNGH